MALGVYDRLPWWGVLPGLAITFAVVIINIVRVFAMINRLTKLPAAPGK